MFCHLFFESVTIFGLFLDGGVVTVLQDTGLPKQTAGWISAAPYFFTDLSGGILLVGERLDGSWRGQGYRHQLCLKRVKCERFTGVIQAP